MLAEIPPSINDYDISPITQEVQAMKYDVISTFKKSIPLRFQQSQEKQNDYSLSTAELIDRKEVLMQLDNISKLQDNWDSLGANKVSKKCINNVNIIINSLYNYIPSPEIYPNPNGTITLDWEVGEQLLSIEIGDTHYSSYWEVVNDTKMDSEIFKGEIPNFLFIALQHLYTNSFHEEYAASFY